MYKLYASDEKVRYEISELAKMFLHDDEFEIAISDNSDSKDEQKRSVYNFLSDATGKQLDWGILTGVRPGKLFSALAENLGCEIASEKLKNEYYLSDSKIDLLLRTYLTQKKISFNTDANAVGLYIGIPFCPSRCLYCSFTSNLVTDSAASEYMAALEKEIAAVSRLLHDSGKYVDSVYVGGGTPTALPVQEFEKLLLLTDKYFRNNMLSEYTVECGRPDTVSEEKLKLIQNHGVDRISINPQTMKDETLRIIGRNHTTDDIIKAYSMARNITGCSINMDLIAGLPGESTDDFKNTINKIVDLNPENITVHTLAVKKASRLIEQDKDYAFKSADVVRTMLDYSSLALKEAGYSPYYLYRQKHMAGNFENVGYCKEGFPGIYNIRIMEENQTIIALGAGGISKLYYPDENRLERVPNVSNYSIYIDRIEDMIERKEKGLNG